MLVRAGVVERYEYGKRVTYALTPAGKELRPIVEALGQWGIRWVQSSAPRTSTCTC
jgi:DNA-binding HxlR family transcriptional regulator